MLVVLTNIVFSPISIKGKHLCQAKSNLFLQYFFSLLLLRSVNTQVFYFIFLTLDYLGYCFLLLLKYFKVTVLLSKYCVYLLW